MDNDQPVEQGAARRRQALWPLLVLAASLLVVGIVAASRSPQMSEAPSATIAAPALSLELPGDLEREGPARALVYQWLPDVTQQRRYSLHQESVVTREPEVSPGAPLEREAQAPRSAPMKVTLVLDGALGAAPDSARALKLTRAQLAVHQQERALAPAVTSQLEQVLASATLLLQIEPHGRVTQSRWRGATNPQLRPSMRLVENAVVALLPRLQREPVNPGEAWTYALPWAGEPNANDLVLRGQLSVRSVFEGTVTREGRLLAIISQRLISQGQGQRPGADAIDYDVQGQGEGLVWFDIEAGQLMRYDLRVTQSVTFTRDAQRVTQRAELALSSAPR